MTITDLINAHESPLVMVACFVQVIFAFSILFATAEQPAMTPHMPWVGRGHVRIPLRRMLRFVLCLGWVGVIFGAMLSGIGILSDLSHWSGPVISQAQNDFGVMVSRISGAIILPHVSYIVWKLATVWVSCGFHIHGPHRK